jgi:hypothetical protein
MREPKAGACRPSPPTTLQNPESYGILNAALKLQGVLVTMKAQEGFMKEV